MVQVRSYRRKGESLKFKFMVGIYKIENTVNGKVYIGQSKRLKNRWYNHKYDLKNKIHKNNHLQCSFNKHGLEAFKFDIIEECRIEELNNREIYWINFYNSLEEGYNVRDEKFYRTYEYRDLIFINKYDFSLQKEMTVKEFEDLTKRRAFKAVEKNSHKDWYVFYKFNFNLDQFLIEYKERPKPKYREKSRSKIKLIKEGNITTVIKRFKPKVPTDRF